MKKIIYVFAIAIIFCACKKETPLEYTIISGTILNTDAKTITISSQDQTFKETITINDNGQFADTLKAKKDHYSIYDGENFANIYLDTGYHLNISYDAKDFSNTLTFTGIGSEISDYLHLSKNRETEIIGDLKKVYKLNEDGYKAKYTDVKAAKNELLVSKSGIPEDFKIKEERNNNYSYLLALSWYEISHSYYTNAPDFKISEGFLNELEGLKYDNEEDFLFSQNYNTLVNAHYIRESKKLAKSDSIASDIAFLRTVSVVSNENMRNALLFDTANSGITYTEDFESFYTIFIEASTNQEQKKKITEIYNSLLTTTKGQPSPKFIDYENYAGGTTSLEDLNGKYVYVDVWATWCSPCIIEIPFLKEIEKTYHNKNIEFVSISVDKMKDRDKWEKMIAEKGLGGIQLFTDKDFNSKFIQDYSIKGIPRFILIDPSGNIVSANAPRPSDAKLIDLFNELNI